MYDFKLFCAISFFFISAVTDSASIFVFPLLAGVPVSIASSTKGLKNCLLAAEIKTINELPRRKGKTLIN